MPITYTYQWQRTPDGGTTVQDIAGASGSFVGTPPFSQDEVYRLTSAELGDKVRLKCNDGVTDFFTPWSATVSASPVTPPGAALVRDYSFDTGDWSQFGGSGHVELAPNATATLQQTVRRGSSGYAAKFSLPPTSQLGGQRGRCQVYDNDSPDYGRVGIEEYYGFSFYVEPGSSLWSGGWNNLCSWHNSDNANTAVTEGNVTLFNTNGPWQLRMTARGGIVNGSTGACTYSHQFDLTSFGSIAFGQWYDVIIRKYWALDASGFVQMWVNNQLVVPLYNMGTMFYKQDNVTPDKIYWKMGYDNGGVGPATVYEDCGGIASDWASIIGQFPAGAWSSTPPT